MAQTQLSYAENRDPGFAALLSLLPGLGQFYNGEPRKGLLFLDVAVLNYLLLFTIMLAPVLSKSLEEFAQHYGLKINQAFLVMLAQLQLGSPLSLIIIGLLASFVCYAVRDAYDRALLKRRRAIYADAVIELPEAASGSYIIHISVILSLAVTALFFLLPKPAAKQIIEIEFMNSVLSNTIVKVKTDKKSQNNNQAKIKHFDPNKPVQKTAPKQDLARSSSQTSNSSSAASSSKTNSASQAKAAAESKSQADAGAQTSSQKSISQALANPLSNFVPRPAETAKSAAGPAAAIPAAGKLAASFNPAALLPRSMQTASLSQAAPSTQKTDMLSQLPSAVPSGLSRAASKSLLPQGAPGTSKQIAEDRLPEIASVPDLGSGGSKHNFEPISSANRSGNPAGSSAAPGPLQISRGKSGPSIPGLQTLSFQSNDGKNDSDKGIPTPLRGGRGRSNDGPIAIVPQTGCPVSGSSDRPLNFDAPKGNSSPASAKDPDFSRFMANLQRKIKSNWFPPKDLKNRRVKVVFKIHSGGQMSNLRLLQGTGYVLADDAALRAVENSAPFEHLPDGSPENVDIEFTFDYNVFSRAL